MAKFSLPSEKLRDIAARATMAGISPRIQPSLLLDSRKKKRLHLQASGYRNRKISSIDLKRLRQRADFQLVKWVYCGLRFYAFFQTGYNPGGYSLIRA